MLGSSGSLLELMLEHMRDGTPIELTDPEATRYFMTPREAVSLDPEGRPARRTGEIYWLDMGAPVRIVDLADRLLALGRARRHAARARSAWVGLRPGEKLREELTTEGLSLARTSHRRIWMAQQPLAGPGRQCAASSRRCGPILRRSDAMTALADLCAGVPEYAPSRHAREQAMAASIVRMAGGGRRASARA